MTDQEIEALIDRITKRSKDQLLKLQPKAKTAFMTTQLEKTIWLAWEELETRRRPNTKGEPWSPHPFPLLANRLHELGKLWDELYNSLPAQQQAVLIHTQHDREKEVIDPWRKANGFLTIDEMERAIVRYGYPLIDEFTTSMAYTLKRSEIPELEARFQALKLAPA